MIATNYCHMIILLKSLTSSSGNQASMNNALYNVLKQSTASQLVHSTVTVYSTLLQNILISQSSKLITN